MNDSDPEVTGGKPPAPRQNGTARSNAGAGRRRPSKPAAGVPEGMESKLAAFAAVAPAPMDAQMWPAHTAAWLAPELHAVLPASSGLRAERRYKVPAPDFLHFAIASAPLPPAPPEGGGALAPDVRLSVPASDLAPLGWDPRAIPIAGPKGKAR